ncbi:MAG: class I SAM-dependent methyltransferase [Wenzhouxiangellaceae bacterium]
MATDEVISGHYSHGNLLQAIQAAIARLGKTVETITIDDLGPVDEFHIGGRLATEHLFDQLSFPEQSHLLDVGCGLGGAARFVATRYKTQVTGIDLTEEYIETGNTLCAWVKLDNQVDLHQGSATAMPFANESFDGAYMLHVGMNIEDKERLFQEVSRVLRPGSEFAVYDVMRMNQGDLKYPVPWASETSASHLATPEQYKQALAQAGFEVTTENNRRDFALEFFKTQREKTEASGGPPPLGLHTLMKKSTATKFGNMIENISAGYIAPVEMIACKR